MGRNFFFHGSCLTRKSKTKQKWLGFSMMHGWRIPDPTKGQGLVDLDFMGLYTVFFLLLMVQKSQRTHLKMYKNPANKGITYINLPTSTGQQPDFWTINSIKHVISKKFESWATGCVS